MVLMRDANWRQQSAELAVCAVWTLGATVQARTSLFLCSGQLQLPQVAVVFCDEKRHEGLNHIYL
jgi:hypothetical protein